MDEMRHRFKACNESKLCSRFGEIIRDWSDEIENPVVDWCLSNKNLVYITESMLDKFNDLVYFGDDTKRIGFEFGPFLKLSVDFLMLEIIDHSSEDGLSKCKVELTFNFDDFNHEITYQLVKTINVKLRKVKAGCR